MSNDKIHLVSGEEAENVAAFPTKEDSPPAADKVLNAAEGKLESVILIGFDHDDDLYLAASESRISELLYLLERAKQIILEY